MANNKYPYKKMIGVGGIGTGSFFMLNGNHSLGREESRSGRFLDKKDYCKLHIISHYVKVLLGPSFSVIPVGKVGNDEPGKRLLSEMKEDGLSVEYVETDPERHTLYSICILYPDKSGGNLTTDDSACAAVDEKLILKTEKEFSSSRGAGIALAVPEVSLSVREYLLDMASEYEFFRAASFTSGEMESVIAGDLLKKTDLLCINMDEALNALKAAHRKGNSAEEAVKLFTTVNPKLLVSITDGKNGSYLWDGSGMFYTPAVNVQAVSTAGAGDAYTAGLTAGIAAGLTLCEARKLAALTGAYSVLSPHTINKELNKAALLSLRDTSGASVPQEVVKFLQED